MNEEELESEAEELTELLRGKAVKRCARHRPGEVVLFFEDGTRLFVNAKSELDFSVTEG